MAVTARGLAKAAEILAGQFTLVATNVPYLGRGNRTTCLKEYCMNVFLLKRKPISQRAFLNDASISVAAVGQLRL